MGKELSNFDISLLVDTINPCKTLETKILEVNQGRFAVSFHKNAPLKGKKYYEDEEWIAVFAGDLIEKVLPWKFILKTLEYKNFTQLRNFCGYFSITALNKERNKLYVISDRRSQLPVFYFIDDTNIYISTELSTFFRLPVEKTFNLEWLWEYLFFNFTIGQTSFFKDVNRMPPANVLEIDIDSGKFLFHEYATKFRKKECLLEGKKAFEHAYNIFKNNVPKYFTGANTVALSLTSGWDSRTNLSFCENPNLLTLYTYGVPGCVDLVEASKIAHNLNIKHFKILFDKNFENELPSLMFDTIYLSSAHERISRSSLLYVYKKLTRNAQRFPLVISGWNLDGLFRGHFAFPPQISSGMVEIFSTGEKKINESFWENCLGTCYEPFERHILKKIDYLEKEYGKLSESSSRLSYILYEVSPKYFAGELSIAKYFTTLRVPGWDNELIELAFSIKDGTLSFSPYSGNHKWGSFEEIVLQAYLISRNGGPLREIPVRGIPPRMVSYGKGICDLIRIKNLAPKKIINTLLRRPYPPLGDWNKWLGKVLKDEIDKLLFVTDSRISNYFTPEFVNSLSNQFCSDRISKLVTVELILRSFFEIDKEIDKTKGKLSPWIPRKAINED